MAPANKRRGPRCKLTLEVLEKIVSAVRAGNYAAVAAEYAGVSERTFYRWLQRGRAANRGRYREFFQAVSKAERDAEVRAVAMVQKHMEDHWQAAMTYLERKFPERWGRRDRLSVEVNPREVLAELLSISAEDLEEVVETAADRR